MSTFMANTGNIELRNIAISNEGVSSKKLTAPSLSVGEKVTLQDSFTMGDSELVSKPTVTYQASGESKTYTISDMARKTVTLAQNGLEAALTTDAGDNVYPGEKIHLKLSIKNTGNNGYTGLTATLSDEVITLEYSGAQLRFLKKLAYRVTFDSAGGSAVAPIKCSTAELSPVPRNPSATDMPLSAGTRTARTPCRFCSTRR